MNEVQRKSTNKMHGLTILSPSFHQAVVTVIEETTMLPWVVPQSGWRQGRAPPEFSQS